MESILQRKPDFRRPNLKHWARQMRTLLEVDGRSPQRIEAVIRWCRSDPFWSVNVLNPASLRKHFDRLYGGSWIVVCAGVPDFCLDKTARNGYNDCGPGTGGTACTQIHHG